MGPRSFPPPPPLPMSLALTPHLFHKVTPEPFYLRCRSKTPLATQRYRGCPGAVWQPPGVGVGGPAPQMLCGRGGGKRLCFIYQTPQTAPPPPRGGPAGIAAPHSSRKAQTSARPPQRSSPDLGAPPPQPPSARSRPGRAFSPQRAGPTAQPPTSRVYPHPNRTGFFAPSSQAFTVKRKRRRRRPGSVLTGPGGSGGGRGPTAAAALYGGGRGEREGGGGRTRLSLPPNHRAARRERLNKTRRPRAPKRSKARPTGEKKKKRNGSEPPPRGEEERRGAETRWGNREAAVRVLQATARATPGTAQWAGAPRAGQRLRRSVSPPHPPPPRGSWGAAAASARARCCGGERDPGPGRPQAGEGCWVQPGAGAPCGKHPRWRRVEVRPCGICKQTRETTGPRARVSSCVL